MLFHFDCFQTPKLLKELRTILHKLKGKEKKITTNPQVEEKLAQEGKALDLDYNRAANADKWQSVNSEQC